MPSMPAQIESSRLQLRRWTPNDAAARREALYISDGHLRPWIPFMSHEPRTLEATREVLVHYALEFEVGLHHRFAVWADGRLIGEVLLIGGGPAEEREVGYWQHVSHCGHGYMTEAVDALLTTATEALDVRRYRFRCDRRNSASSAIAKRLGAEFDALESAGEDVVLEHWLLAG